MKNIYDKPAIEFTTVAREYCLLMENVSKYSKEDFMTVASRMLALLYLKAHVLPEVKPILDGALEETVDEEMYESVRVAIKEKLADKDEYLEVFKDDMHLSEEPLTAEISEDMADIFQDLRNFCDRYRQGIDEIMNDALAEVVDKFRTYWGQRLCNALRALHAGQFATEEN